jgi:hypothetical protein
MVLSRKKSTSQAVARGHGFGRPQRVGYGLSNVEPTRDSGGTREECRFLVRLSSYDIAKRAVLADPNLTLIRAEAFGTADLGGIAPNHLRVVAANLVLPAGIFPVVVKRTLCSPTGYDIILADLLALALSIGPN